MGTNEALFSAVVTIAVAIIGVASLAVLFSRNSTTVDVIKASTGGFAQSLGVALSPITGSGGAFGGSLTNPVSSF